jgi:hypothetical protein
MSQSVKTIDFTCDNPSEGSGPPSVDIPDSLQRASLRLGFPPSYVIVGVYRLLSDKTLSLPVWDLCRNGFLKGAAVGSIWVRACCSESGYCSKQMSEVLTLPYMQQSFLTFSIQRGLIRTFWIKYVRVFVAIVAYSYSHCARGIF